MEYFIFKKICDVLKRGYLYSNGVCARSTFFKEMANYWFVYKMIEKFRSFKSKENMHKKEVSA